MKLQSNPYYPKSPPYRIGILGGGQLGQMMGLAGRAMGYIINCWQPGNDPCPLGAIVDYWEQREFDDIHAMQDIAANNDIIISEFENIPISLMRGLAALKPVIPDPEILYIAQNRHLEKQFLARFGLQPAANFYLENAQSCAQPPQNIPLPALLKTNNFGYDGKGQYAINNRADWDQYAKPNHILEEKLDFDYEFSLLMVRDFYGNIGHYHPSLNIHRAGIIRQASPILPPYNTAMMATIAQCHHLMQVNNYVGLLCFEFFMLKNGTVRANEIAPRPHNSFHWTMNGCLTSQFQQIIRIAAHMPLGDMTITNPCTMINLIGDDVRHCQQYYENPRAFVHLYGKTTIQEGRKMGHVNLVD